MQTHTVMPILRADLASSTQKHRNLRGEGQRRGGEGGSVRRFQVLPLVQEGTSFARLIEAVTKTTGFLLPTCHVCWGTKG